MERIAELWNERPNFSLGIPIKKTNKYKKFDKKITKKFKNLGKKRTIIYKILIGNKKKDNL